MRTLVKILFILSISLGLLHGSNVVNPKVYDEKSRKYYKKYKQEWNILPKENKDRIIKSFKRAMEYNLGYTLAATRFLENRGSDTSYSNKKSINKNIHKDYITYDCGDYGINTMTYLDSIKQATKDHDAHIAACKKLATDKKLNLKMAMATYNYALRRYNGNLIKAWNYYNTGRDKIINDRIFKVKGFIMVLQEEIKKTSNS